MIRPIELSGPQYDAIKASFVSHMAQADLRDTPSPLVWISPTRLEGPTWLSAMWNGWLRSRFYLCAWRYPGFEGQLVEAKALIDQGVYMHEQSSECGQFQLRVEAADIEAMLDEDDDVSAAALERLVVACKEARARFAKRDKNKPAAKKQKA